MIVKMKFINISGPRNDIDRVTDLYLSRYEIQLESALSELKTVDNLRPFVELNPYRDALAKAVQFVGYLPNADDVVPDTKWGWTTCLRSYARQTRTIRSFRKRKKTEKEDRRASCETTGHRAFPPAGLRSPQGIALQVHHIPIRTHCGGILPQDAEVSHG